MEISGGASHARYYRALGKGRFAPVASPDQGEPSCPPVEPPEQGISLPMHPGPGCCNIRHTRHCTIPSKEPSRSLETHRPLFRQRLRPKGFHALWKPDQGVATPEPPAGISGLLPTKAVPWNPSLEEGGWREEVTSGSGRASSRSVFPTTNTRGMRNGRRAPALLSAHLPVLPDWTKQALAPVAAVPSSIAHLFKPWPL